MESLWTVKFRGCVRVDHPGIFHFVPKKPFPWARLICVLKGKVVLSFEGKELTAHEGQTVFLPGSLFLQASYPEKVNTTLVFRFQPISGSFPEGPFVYPKNDAVLSRAGRFAESLREEPNPDPHLALSYFYRILHHLKDAEALSEKRAHLLPAIRHIEQNFARSEKVSLWAAKVYMSETAFRKLFREEMGVSPIEYRNGLRLRFAQDLIAEGVPTAVAAREAGFGSVSFYLRLRKKELTKEERL